MLNVKNKVVSKVMRITLSAVNTRDGIGQKDNDKRRFNFVIKGLAVSSMLFGYVLTTGLNAFASTSATKISAQQTLFDSKRTISASVPHSILLSTEINGKKQSYPYPSRYQNNQVIVPLSSVAKSLGVSIQSDTKHHTVTAKHGSTTVKVTVGSSVVFVNGKPYRVPTTVTAIQGVVMVPSQVISKLLDSSVSIEFSSNDKSISFTTVQDPVKHTTRPPAPPKKPVHNTVVNGITVKYGQHTYGCKSQAEYDKVVGIVQNALKQMPNYQFGNGSEAQYYTDYLNGARFDGDYSNSTDKNMTLLSIQLQYGIMQKVGATNADIIQVYKIFNITQDLLGRTSLPDDGTSSSAYDMLVRNVENCGAIAQVYSLAFDMMGYNTAVIGGDGHASVDVQIHGKWFCLDGQFYQDDLSNLSADGEFAISQPTWGSF